MILARSPYIISVDEVGAVGSKINIYLWNGTGSAPSTPQYTLSKDIPASNITLMTYDVSPYIREYFDLTTFQNIYNSITNTTNTHWCNVKIERFKRVGTTYTLLTTLTTTAVDGYGYYNDEYNPDSGNVLLREDTYYYLYDSTANLATDTLKRAGQITIDGSINWYVRYTNLNSGLVQQLTFVDTRIKSVYRVYPTWYADGNLVEVFNASNVLQWSGTFMPKEECKYTPVVIDYINKFGGWSRDFFFKASYDTFEVENSEYNLMQSDLVDYDILQGQRKVFNANGKEKIRVNTGWVNENWKESLKEIMLSERVLLDNKPVKINTKQTDLNKHINMNLINYTLEFEYAYDTINSVV
jgi:hypothetical protein